MLKKPIILEIHELYLVLLSKLIIIKKNHLSNIMKNLIVLKGICFIEKN